MRVRVWQHKDYDAHSGQVSNLTTPLLPVHIIALYLNRTIVPLALPTVKSHGQSPWVFSRSMLFSAVILLTSLVVGGVGCGPPRSEHVQAARAALVTVYVTRTGHKYHQDWCPHLAKSKIPMSLRDAVDGGYSACTECAPPILSQGE